MKKSKRILAFLITFVFLIGFTPVYAAVANNGISANSGNQIITIDGSFSDWKNLPYSYEYNWDNPYIYPYHWNPVTQKNETLTITDENGKPYNTTIRHKMSLYRDNENVYLHIIFAKDDGFNGDNYIFYCDGQQVQFQVGLPGGKTISQSSKKDEIYKLQVRHENSGSSSSETGNSKAILKRNANGLNDEMELQIPLKEFHKQNRNIDASNIRMLEFFTPNLMYRHILCAGTDTAPYVGIAGCMAVAGVGCFVYTKKKRKTTI